MNETPDLLSVLAAAEYLTVTVACLRKWIWLRRIRYFRIGRRIRFLRRDLDAFIEAGAVLPVGRPPAVGVSA